MNAIRQMVLWGMGRRRPYRVRGESMRPTLLAGDLVLVDPGAFRRRPPRIGELVVARHPWRRNIELVKRIGGRTPDGNYILKSDNPDAAIAPSALGPVPPSLLLGRIETRLPAR